MRECEYLYKAIANVEALEEIHDHLSYCKPCERRLHKWFRRYKKSPIETANNLKIDLPKGIINIYDFLEHWRVGSAQISKEKNLTTSFYSEAMCEEEILKLIARIKGHHEFALDSVLDKAPLLVRRLAFGFIEDSYRELYKMMGHSRFWYYKTGNFNHEGDLDELINWWHIHLIGAHE